MNKQESILLAVFLALTGCSSDSETNTVDDGNNSNGDVTDLVDITDVNFTSRAGSCADYEGYYKSDVMDLQRNMSFIGDVSVLPGASTCTLQSNTIPNHDFNDSSAHFHDDVAELSSSFDIPINPQFAASATPLSLGTAEAVLLNGVTLDVLAAACYGVGNEQLGNEKIGCGPEYDDHPWRYDPMSPLNSFGTDSHNAHTQPNGKYHYHGNPMAMFETDCTKATSASGVIGFAADGFPVYGSCINVNGAVREATSSYKLKSGTRQAVAGYTTPVQGQGSIASNNYDGQFRGDYEFVAEHGDLDECNGMTVDGQYGYYITNSYPWVLNCYKGQIDNSVSGVAEDRAHSHDHGHEHW